MCALLVSESDSADDGWSIPGLLDERKLQELLAKTVRSFEFEGARGRETVPSLTRALASKSLIWARNSLDRLPIRLTLESVSAFVIFMTLVLPRALVYLLVYPLFRLVFGTLYPAYASYKAVRTKNVKEYVKWMMYWIVFALFTCAETFTDVFFSFWFPFYYEIKIILVLWLLSPATKGSSILYRRFVHPALCRREAEIDDALARATEQGYTAVLQLGTKGVNYATTVLMQTAIKNIPNVVPSGTLATSQSDSAISSLASPRASPSQSETDATTTMKPQQQQQQQQLRGKKPRKLLTRSEEVVAEAKLDSRLEKYVEIDSDSDGEDAQEVGSVAGAEEEMKMDYALTVETSNESIDLVYFKKPEVLFKEPKRREDSVTRRKPRTRAHSGRNIDSDFSDDG